MAGTSQTMQNKIVSAPLQTKCALLQNVMEENDELMKLKG
jgi:hypothetical protein